MRAFRKTTTRGDPGEKEELRERGGGVDVKEAKKIFPKVGELKWLDQFPYYPAYRFHAFRSNVGAVCCLLMGFIFSLRMGSSLIDYMDMPPTVTESRQQFPRDSSDQFELPRIGLQFRQNGWKPFNDPRYLSIKFEQGIIQRSGNVSYTDLGSKECAFIDKSGRLIADEARCPRSSGMYLQGDFHDVTFAFVRARLLRCDNGTDVEGKPLPGMCFTPSVISKLMHAPNHWL